MSRSQIQGWARKRWMRGALGIRGLGVRELASAGLGCLVLGLGAWCSVAQPCGKQPVGILAGPILNSTNHHQYYLLEPSCWTDAEATAVSMGGHLVTINDPDELQWVSINFSRFGGTERGLWIGLYDPDPAVNSSNRFTRQLEFVWSSGQPVATSLLYWFWWDYPGEPDTQPGTTELYGQMLPPDFTNGVALADAPDSTLLNAVMEIPLPLEIISQPQNTVVGVGGDTDLLVVADGTTPLQYQWQFMGANIDGGTNSRLCITNSQAAQSGAYRVVVSNESGTLTTEPAVLSLASVMAWADPDNGITALTASATNLVALAAGRIHCLALRKDGTVVAWGDNERGQTAIPAGLTNVSAIAAGGLFSLALKTDGTVVGWGYDNSGQLAIPSGLSNVVAIAAGDQHSVALKSDGTVVVWPPAGIGPTGLSDVVGIAAGDNHILALRADGTVVAWGENYSGQANVPPYLANVVAVAAGSMHSLALQADGTVTAWGEDQFGQSNVPPGLTNVVAIAAGRGHSLALRADGAVVSWGTLGPSLPSHLPNILAIAAGAFSSLALLGDRSPHIAVQPCDQMVKPGRQVSLKTRLVGLQPMTYQWQFKGTDIPGATADTYWITDAQAADAGTYALVASNQRGVITSRQAKLVVSDAVPVVLTPASLSNGQFHFKISGPLGRKYIIETSADLTHWTVLQTISPTGMPFDFVDPSPLTSGNRFYRVRLGP